MTVAYLSRDIMWPLLPASEGWLQTTDMAKSELHMLQEGLGALSSCSTLYPESTPLGRNPESTIWGCLTWEKILHKWLCGVFSGQLTRFLPRHFRESCMCVNRLYPPKQYIVSSQPRSTDIWRQVKMKLSDTDRGAGRGEREEEIRERDL